jgi:hypothetical protein
LAFTSLSPGVNGNTVEVQVGYVAPPDNEGPVTTNVEVSPSPVFLNGAETVTANVDDTGKGGNDIASAEYSLNGGTWTAMTASDGAFDNVSEDVEGDFTATQLGENEVCVRGTDAAGNTGDESCQGFIVSYKFFGFFQPIDNDNVNTVKAGQAIPAKWRILDANDAPISDPASFTMLASYPISCTTLAGDPEDAVEEVASGSSGLQYDGDGYWQFNWKTPKTYADSCRAMYVEFKGPTYSPVVTFKFKK